MSTLYELTKLKFCHVTMWSRHPDDGHCRHCKRLAFFRLTIDGVLSRLSENFSITTYINEVAKTKTLYRGTWVALLP